MKLYGRERKAAAHLDAMETLDLFDELARVRAGHGQSVHRRRIAMVLSGRGQSVPQPSRTHTVATAQSVEMTRINFRRIAMQAYEQGAAAATGERVFSRKKQPNLYAQGIAKAAYDLGYIAEETRPGFAFEGTDSGVLPQSLEELVEQYLHAE